MFAGFVSAQNNTQDDVKARIGMYLQLNPEVFNVQVTSSEAKSLVTVITNAFEQYMVVPEISLNNVSGNERTEIVALQDRLRNLLQNPPTWDQIVAQQTAINAAPASAPVYAGDEKARAYYNAKSSGKTRASYGETGQPISSEASKTPVVPDPPKKQE